MSKFKVGDKVVWTRDNIGIMQKGLVYTVGAIDVKGSWIVICEDTTEGLYYPDNFELYVEQEQQPDNTSVIVDWLEKLAYLIESDTTVGSQLEINLRNQAVLETDHGTITGNQEVVEFINNRYSQLSEQANKAKREQLLKDIVSAKEAYEAKVRELELLEGK